MALTKVKISTLKTQICALNKELVLLWTYTPSKMKEIANTKHMDVLILMTVTNKPLLQDGCLSQFSSWLLSEITRCRVSVYLILRRQTSSSSQPALILTVMIKAKLALRLGIGLRSTLKRVGWDRRFRKDLVLTFLRITQKKSWKLLLLNKAAKRTKKRSSRKKKRKVPMMLVCFKDRSKNYKANWLKLLKTLMAWDSNRNLRIRYKKTKKWKNRRKKKRKRKPKKKKRKNQRNKTKRRKKTTIAKVKINPIPLILMNLLPHLLLYLLPTIVNLFWISKQRWWCKCKNNSSNMMILCKMRLSC